MSFRVIAGGRDAAAAGLLIHGAAQIATMAGGLRRGPAQDEPFVVESSTEGELLIVLAGPDRRRRLA